MGWKSPRKSEEQVSLGKIEVFGMYISALILLLKEFLLPLAEMLLIARDTLGINKEPSRLTWSGRPMAA